uniref:Polypyrimidine tract-binding protein 3 (Trinotate prediction) n=1 Tax=Henneguya salminicola TaxID=69463 RepID=A0A6G3MHZ4_HENSL
MPARNSENPHLTQDYSNSPYKRYKRLGSRNYRHIYPPSTTLHVSNITHDMTLKDIKDLFSKVAGVNVDNVESLRDIKGQAFVFMNTLTDAIYGLMVCVVFISKSKLFFFKYRRNFTTIFFQIPVNSRFPSRKVKILPLHHINQNIQGVEEQVFHKIFY